MVGGGTSFLLMAAAGLVPGGERLVALRGGERDAKKWKNWIDGASNPFQFPQQGAKLDSIDRKTAAALMKKRGITNVNKAADILRGVHKRDPTNVQVKLELADAICTIIRIKTNANSLVLEGTQDCPAFKKIWGKLGSEALPLAIEARKAMPDSVKALALYADAFMFYSSSKGIVKQALTGVGKKYIAVAKELCKHPEWDSAVGEVFLGGFYNVAPWPVGSKQKAMNHLLKGAKLAPTRRNLYYVGVVAYQTGDYLKAKEYFSQSLSRPICKAQSSTECDIADFISKEAKRGLKLAQEAMAS